MTSASHNRGQEVQKRTSIRHVSTSYRKKSAYTPFKWPNLGVKQKVTQEECLTVALHVKIPAITQSDDDEENM